MANLLTLAICAGLILYEANESFRERVHELVRIAKEASRG